ELPILRAFTREHHASDLSTGRVTADAPLTILILKLTARIRPAPPLLVAQGLKLHLTWERVPRDGRYLRIGSGRGRCPVEELSAGAVVLPGISRACPVEPCGDQVTPSALPSLVQVVDESRGIETAHGVLLLRSEVAGTDCLVCREQLSIPQVSRGRTPS